MDDIVIEKNQKIGKTYEKNMAGDGYQRMGKSLKRHQKSELNAVFEAGGKTSGNPAYNRSTLYDTSFKISKFSRHFLDSSRSSLSTPASFIFLESESSAQEFKYDKLRDESNQSSQKWDAESDKQVLSKKSNLNATRSFDKVMSKRYTSGKNTSSIAQLADKKITVNFLGEKTSTASAADNDVKVNSSKNSIQDYEIKELKESLEKSTKCLLTCLGKLHNRTLERERPSLKENSYAGKVDGNVIKYIYSEENVNGVDMKREDDGSDAFSSTSSTLKSNTITDVKRNASAVPCVTREDSSKSIHKQSSNSKTCACDCCNGKCLHSQNSSKKLYRDLLAKVARTKTALKARELPNNSSVKTLKKVQSRSKTKSQDLLVPNSQSIGRKSSSSDRNEAKGNVNISRLVHKLNAARATQTFKRNRRAIEKFNAIKKERSENYCCKKNRDSKTIKSCLKEDQLDEQEVKNVLIDKEVDSNPNKVLLLAFIFVVSVLFCFVLFIFFFVLAN